MCAVVESLERHGFSVSAQDTNSGFLFKCFPQGGQQNYSWFRASRGDETYEVRMNLNSKNMPYSSASIALNLDVAVIRENSINPQNIVDSSKDLITFGECKNYNGFAELAASFEGIIWELQRDRLYINASSGYAYPCCLFISGTPGISATKDRYFRSKNMSIRMYAMFRPGSRSVADFVQYWF
jgi:hypothetical protein